MLHVVVLNFYCGIVFFSMAVSLFIPPSTVDGHLSCS